MKRIGNLVANLLLASVALIATLAVFEVGLRLTGHGALYDIYSKPSVFWRHDPLLGWSHQPGAHGTYVGPRPWPIEFEAPVSINSIGLRGPEIPVGKDPAERVLFLGDSMVAGFEVRYDQTFVARLQPELTARLGRPVRTINAGVRGYGTDQYLLYYRSRGRLLHPDVVVIFHSGNDLLDNTTLHETRRPFGKAALVPDGKGLKLVGAPVHPYPQCSEVSLSRSFQVIERGSLAGEALCRVQAVLFDHSALFSFLSISIPWEADFLTNLYHLGNPHLKAGPNHWRALLTDRILRSLIQEIRADGAEVLLIGAPAHLAMLDLDSLRAAGAEIKDLDPVWSAPQEEMRWKHDSHFNPEGHRQIAKLLAPHIEALLRKHSQLQQGAG